MEKNRNPIVFQDYLVENDQNFIVSLCRNALTCKEKSGYTLSEISIETDISMEQLKSLLYNENKDYKISTIVKYAKFFGISIDELVGAGTLPSRTKKSLQTIRTLEPSYTEFFVWLIDFVHKSLTKPNIRQKCVPMICPNLTKNGNMEIHLREIKDEPIDISHVDKETRSKTIMAIKVPNNQYMPMYCCHDILLIANDRVPYPHETFLILLDGFLYFCHRRERKDGKKRIVEFYSIVDNGLRANEEDVDQKIGYVAGVI